MAKNIKELTNENDNLNEENDLLQHLLRKALETIEVFKSDKIDALVIADEKALKIYTETTADQPYRILIEKMHEGAVTLNEDGIVLYCNSSFAGMAGLPLQKVIGTKFKQYIGETSAKTLETLLKNEGVKALKEEVSICAGNGSEVPALMSVTTLSLDNSVVLSIILTDLTVQNENQEKLKMYARQLEETNIELERANEELSCQIEEKEKRGAELTIARTAAYELEELNRHKEKVLATLSHDLRSPLTGIIGLAEIIKENFETFENNLLKEMLELLYKSTTDELSMLDSMVEWARIKYASEAFSPEKIKLAQAVKKAFETIHENAVTKYIHFNSDIEDSINVFADRKMLLSILQNIVSNSLKHTPSGGNITISARRKEDKIIIGIKDTGTGMSKEILKNLFTPQIISLSNERKDGNGAGIGLLLVKSFIEQNGGEIWAESIEGEGSSFYFTLPAKEQRNMNMQFLNNRNDLVMEQRALLQRQL